jgi:hypothetical protein
MVMRQIASGPQRHKGKQRGFDSNSEGPSATKISKTVAQYARGNADKKLILPISFLTLTDNTSSFEFLSEICPSTVWTH